MVEESKDAFYMQMALELAQKGQGWTAPNPMVGAIIIKDGVIIGSGVYEAGKMRGTPAMAQADEMGKNV